LKPCEWLLKIGSYTCSKIILITSCTNLSLKFGTPSGRFFPFDFGMYTRRTGEKRNFPSFSCS
ncbi:hypothetical protein RhiirA1_310677, partial [Rhizophagus irregularis]